jgi:hypothetical protein
VELVGASAADETIVVLGAPLVSELDASLVGVVVAAVVVALVSAPLLDAPAPSAANTAVVATLAAPRAAVSLRTRRRARSRLAIDGRAAAESGRSETPVMRDILAKAAPGKIGSR